MIVLVPGERRLPALDRVGEEDGRLVVVDGVEGVGEGFQALAAEIVHQRVELFIRALVEQFRDIALVANVVHQAFAPGRAALIGEGGIIHVRAGLDPFLQGFAARLLEGFALQDAVAQHNGAPAEGLEDGVDLLPQALMHDAVEALAVIVDHPPCVAQVVLPAFLQAFIDIAFIQLRIADEGDLPAEFHVLRPALRSDIVLHQRVEGGGRDAEADRPCREVDIVDILGAARIGLRAAPAAEGLELLARLVAHQVLHGVKDGRGVRLHRDAVFRLQRMEVERRHDRHHGRAGGLVAADLHRAFFLGPDVVGIVDRPGRQPEKALFDGLQHVEIGRHGHSLHLQPIGASPHRTGCGPGPDQGPDVAPEEGFRPSFFSGDPNAPVTMPASSFGAGGTRVSGAASQSRRKGMMRLSP